MTDTMAEIEKVVGELSGFAQARGYCIAKEDSFRENTATLNRDDARKALLALITPVIAECDRLQQGLDEYGAVIRKMEEEVSGAWSSVEVITAERDRLKAECERLRVGLTLIQDSHLGDCPATWDELNHAKGHIMRLRCTARAALSPQPAPGSVET
jgi:hypothetical protein